MNALSRASGFSTRAYVDSAIVGVKLVDDINRVASVSRRQRQLVVGIAEKLEGAVTDEKAERSGIGAWIGYRAAANGIRAGGVKVDDLSSLSRSVSASICMYAIISTKRTASFNSKAIYADCRAYTSTVINN